MDKLLVRLVCANRCGAKESRASVHDASVVLRPSGSMREICKHAAAVKAMDLLAKGEGDSDWRDAEETCKCVWHCGGRQTELDVLDASMEETGQSGELKRGECLCELHRGQSS